MLSVDYKTITGLMFNSSAAHFLRELGEPVSDEQRGVHEPLHAVGHTGLLPPGQAAAEAAGDAGVPARLVEVVHLLHQLRRLLLDGQGLLEVPAPQSRAGV